MKTLLFFIAIVFANALAAAPSETCHMEIPCAVGDRSYHVREPDGWDGVSPLPVLLHFHGWARQGDLIVRHQRIASATRRRGVLLVAPNGLGKSWSFWDAQTQDVEFADAVLRDVAARYPVDVDRVYVSGYSFGSAMAWRYACQSGDDIAGLFAIAGTLDQRETCAEAPEIVRHVHGVSDTVMRFPFGADDETDHAVSLWRARLGCSELSENQGPWQQVSFLMLERTSWSDCANGSTVALDTHPGGHFIPHGWIARQLDDALGLPVQYP